MSDFTKAALSPEEQAEWAEFTANADPEDLVDDIDGIYAGAYYPLPKSYAPGKTRAWNMDSVS